MFFLAFDFVILLAATEGIIGAWWCSSFQFQCRSGGCISETSVCDGFINCPDGSDEIICAHGHLDDDTTFDDIAYSTFAPTFSPPGHKINSMFGVEASKRNLTKYFLNTRRSVRSMNKWGPNIMRTAMALFLADSTIFAPGNITGEEIGYELSMRLISKLILDFFGMDMVAELRKRVNNSNYTNPFYILTLCNAEDLMSSEDVSKLLQQFDAHLRPLWLDIQATATMALSCIVEHPNTTFNKTELKEKLTEMVAEMKQGQHPNGTINNLKTTALVVQAFLATGSYRTDFDLSAAVKYMLLEVNRTYAHLQDLYYVLPILNSMSLVNISSDHCTTFIKTDMDVIKFHENPDKRIQVQVSIYVGDDMDFIRTWKLKVPSNYNFYQVLENIGMLEPTYKIQYSVSEGKPYVVGLRNYQDNAEDGMFWSIYIQPLSSVSKPKRIQKSPAEIQMKDTDELILWYRSELWSDSQSISDSKSA